MGNIATSCAPSIIISSSSTGSNNGVVKVLSSDGRVEVYRRGVKAGEVMVEKPGHFLCNSAQLKVGQRIAGVSADEELQLRQLYLLLPMEMLYSVLTRDEITSLTHHKPSNHFSRIFPQGFLTDFCMFPSSPPPLLDLHPQPQPLSSVQSYSRQRSWTPALETIAETPI